MPTKNAFAQNNVKQLLLQINKSYIYIEKKHLFTRFCMIFINKQS